MAKQKDIMPETPEGLAATLLSRLNEVSTSTKAYTMGDHAEHTWGIPIPSLAFQWLIGGSSVLPCQRFFSISGQPKSFKSTLTIQFGLWNVLAGGIFVPVDTEHKTSASMLDAMTWWCTDDIQKKRMLFKEVNSIDEWQQLATSILEYELATPIRPKKHRIPIYVSIDSLLGRSTEDAMETIMKEGHATVRGYPEETMKVTNWLKKIVLTGTTMSMGWVRHLKQSIEQSHTGPKFREVGGAEAGFRASLGLQVSKKQSPDRYAYHPALPNKDVSAEGYQLFIKSDMSCLGPDKRQIEPDVVWQYVPQEVQDEDGTTRVVQRQIMALDWAGALGSLLRDFKYDDRRKAYASDLKKLNDTLAFTQPKANRIKCDELGMDDVSLTEFGQGIENHPEIRARISRFLNISEYRSVQDADIDKLKE